MHLWIFIHIISCICARSTRSKRNKEGEDVLPDAARRENLLYKERKINSVYYERLQSTKILRKNMIVKNTIR